MKLWILGVAALLQAACAEDNSIDPDELEGGAPTPDATAPEAAPGLDGEPKSDGPPPPKPDGAPGDAGTAPDLPVGPQKVIPLGAVWSYDDTGTDHGQTWLQTSFDFSGWPTGPAQLGYGDGDEKTVLQKTDPARPGAYFLKEIALPAKATQADLTVIHDDGAAVWVNGKPVFEKYMSNGTNYSAWASFIAFDNQKSNASVDLSAVNPFVAGRNIVAVMVKQHSGTSSDLSFDLELTLSYGR